jgi:hypothetical protein
MWSGSMFVTTAVIALSMVSAGPVSAAPKVKFSDDAADYFPAQFPAPSAEPAPQPDTF